MKLVDKFFYFLYTVVPFALVSLPLFFILMGLPMSIKNPLIYYVFAMFVVPNILILLNVVYQKDLPQSAIFRNYFSNYRQKFASYWKISAIYISIVYYLIIGAYLVIQLQNSFLWASIAIPLGLLLTSLFLVIALVRVNTPLEIANKEIVLLGCKTYFSHSKIVVKSILMVVLMVALVPIAGEMLQLIVIPLFAQLVVKMFPAKRSVATESGGE